MKSYPVIQVRYLNKAARQRCNRRHRGVVAVYVTLCMLVIMGAAAISFDLSYLYNRKAEAQKAADASALAGAQNGDQAAYDYAAANGYNRAEGATVHPFIDSQGLYRVTLDRPERLFFAKYFVNGKTSRVGATAAAEHLADLPVPVQNYGIGKEAEVNLSVFGADSWHYNGDPYTPKYMTIDGSPQFNNGNPVDNPQYDGKGYDFLVRMNKSIAEYRAANNNTQYLNVEIFDPGTSNAGGVQSPAVGKSIDEMRSGWNNQTIGTETTYTLTFLNGSETVTLSKTYGADTPLTDMLWDTALQIDLDKYPNPTNIKLNVNAAKGTSENGFQIRVGPPHGEISDTDWVKANGDLATVSADGRMPINFNTQTEIVLNLGQVPPISNNAKIMIDKFDLDVGSSSLRYKETRNDGQVYWHEGKLGDSRGQKNDVWSKDSYDSTSAVPIPKNYPGGTWQAYYTAGLQDTSAWHLSYTGVGGLRLVR